MSRVRFCCEQMRRAVEDPDVPIVYIPQFNEYGVRILDGGTSFIQLQFCPWCGSKLPESLREAWFAELSKRGIDPADDVPPEFTDDRWYTKERAE